ncbi:MAG TPA: ACT domain-containing protein [Candidatus Limnocylindrales bacterium]|nr:ACT domain-containing protein [Candidatus Limnocylindrales bacterium]
MKAFLVDLENRPGEFARVAEALGKKGVNITGITGTTCGTSGRVALITSDDAQTRTALGETKCKFKEIEAVETTLRDEPGALAKIARRLADAGVNIDAIMPTGTTGKDITVQFLTDNPTKAREAVAAAMSTPR